MIHAARVSKSKRLLRTLDVLRQFGEAETSLLAHMTGSCAVHTDIAELRANGYRIACRYCGTTSEGRRVYAYKLEG